MSFNAKDFLPALRFGIEVITPKIMREIAMTTLNLNLPNSIQRHLQEMADMDGVPVDQFVTSAVAEKISALTAETYLRARADHANPAAFRAVLDNVPHRSPVAGDE